MLAFMIAAPASGTGKTAVTCGMLELLNRKGLSPAAFKCGPDYIDPMFHRSVMGMESHNLDLFLSDEDAVRAMFDRYRTGHDAVVCEGVMGYYDGVGGTTLQASAWHAARTLGIGTILVIRPKGASLTLAAQILGLAEFAERQKVQSGDSGGRIAGVILNDCPPMLYRTLAPMLEERTGIPILGYLPHMEEAVFESRHLGLHTAGEIHDLKERIGRIADRMEETIDLDRLCSLYQIPDIACANDRISVSRLPETCGKEIRIAVARDEAFCFFYEEGLDLLRDAGAEICWFSPLHDAKLPEGIHALYLTGGYPELYVRELSENHTMRESVASAVRNGLPAIAECGGFLYLGQELADENGIFYPQAGVLPGTAEKKERLVRFGYAHLHPKEDSMLFRSGEAVPIHEFHYWDSTKNGTALRAVKPVSGRSWECGFVSETMYAGFPHLYFAGMPELAERFLNAAAKQRRLCYDSKRRMP